jgi:endonuclease/exonuclease/phosphatase family metal-dependent hydrolase
MRTYVSRDRRFDWIMISNELEFVSYKVLPDIISDHLAVVAEVKLSKP